MHRFLLAIALAALSFISLMAQTTEMEQDMFEAMRDGDKAVIVAVHAGTDSREAQQTLDRFNMRLRQAYPNYDFREAWTSKAVNKQTANPDALFSQLQKEGYTHVLVQTSELIDCTDMQYLRYVVDNNKGKFKQIRLGEPLLKDVQDYEEVVKTTVTAYGKPKEVNVLMCNGSENVTTDAQYTMLEYTLQDKDSKSWFVGTVDGYPSLDSLIKRLKRQKLKKVNLIPFMFAADQQVMTDRMREWAQSLQKAGYKVTTEMHDLGELDEILNLFEKHIRHAEKYRTLSAKELKLLVR